jgi:N-acetylglucosamine-6-phosphate deacetylase
MAFALAGAKVFDGEKLHDGLAVVVVGNRIADVVPAGQLAETIERRILRGGILAPGFIDVQVNGGGGALLNGHPSLETVRRIAGSHRAFGTTGMLPTVITDAPHVLAEAISAVRAALAAKVPGVAGIHIEGPFLDVNRKGAHDAQHIRTMTQADADMIAGADCGTAMLTVAPNRVKPELIEFLARHGVLVSLGHSDATLAEVQQALDAGACAFTHVFNAMSQMTGREPGMVGAALSDPQSFCGLIADGLHVHDSAMKVAITAKTADRIMLISDAMPAAAGGPEVFELQGRAVHRTNGRLVLADGTLAGSNLTMNEAVRHCVMKLHVNIADALRMASLTPAKFIKRDNELGRIKTGFLASLVHLTDSFDVTQAWIEGK